METTVQCPYAEKSDSLILCSHDPEITGTSAAWRARNSGKIITMPFFCFNRCLYYKTQQKERKAGK